MIEIMRLPTIHLSLRRRYKIVISLFLGFGIVAVMAFVLQNAHFPVFDTAGEVANKQRDLIIFTSILSLVIIVPVFVLLFAIAWRFRASNTKAQYRPNWDHSRVAETIWWGLPALLIIFLSIIIWTSSHQLDPYRPLVSTKQPITIQVVSLQWKWLFIYPDQKVASMNFMQIPKDTPINFVITADSPMNSFWIPQLGGQVYAMNGMTTKLHLMADKDGDFRGSSANLSGDGFSGMTFVARAGSEKEFTDWVDRQQNAKLLDWTTYTELAKPSKDQPRTEYRLKDIDLYDKVVEKYMPHHSSTNRMRGHGN